MEDNLDSATEEISVVGRMLRLFHSPGETFEAVARGHSWHDWVIPTLLTAIVVTVAAQITMPLTLEMNREAIEQRMKANAASMSEDDLARQREVMKKMSGFAEASTLVVTPITIFALTFITAGLLLLVGRLVLGGDIKYGQVLAVQGYTSLILILQAIVLTPIRLEKESILIFLGPALFFDKDALSGFFGSMVGMIDIFVLWQVVLGAIGLTVLTRGSFSKALTSMLILWVVYLAMFGGLMSLNQGG
ncbi:MAG: hypothetical protein HN712_13870 [Gemmatimonadetes bacterium]|nr:hypothetical protein [Gemmatimonadota bacterium]MBT7861405.1 hypothetical protein [Gemmatimonadota bacterium]